MTVVVTGASGTIGSACVQRFLEIGEQVIAQDLDISRWSTTAQVTGLEGNLMDAQVRQALSSTAAAHELRAVVAAHGVAGSAVLADCTSQFVDRVLMVNAVTVPLLYETLRPHLQEMGGAFVAIASQAALAGESGNTAYCAAKFAVVGWITAMAAQESDVTLHALCPGATESQLLLTAQRRFAAAEGLSPEQYYTRRAGQIAVGRYGRPEEIAAAVSYLTGRGRRPVVLAVTGGDVLF